MSLPLAFHTELATIPAEIPRRNRNASFASVV